MSRVLIAGYGYLGRRLGTMLCDAGHEVFALGRHAGSSDDAVRFLSIDLLDSAALDALPSGLDYAFFTAGSRERHAAAYTALYVTGLGNLLLALIQSSLDLKRFFFSSSTAVYGEENGERVDEETPPRPRDFRGLIMLEAEEMAAAYGFPSTVVRFGAIVGPGRNSFAERAARGEALSEEENLTIVNRVHLDDAAGILEFLMNHPSPRELYLAVSSHPVTNGELRARSLSGENLPAPDRAAPVKGKRCLNDRLLAEGYRFQKPDPLFD